MVLATSVRVFQHGWIFVVLLHSFLGFFVRASPFFLPALLSQFTVPTIHSHVSFLGLSLRGGAASSVSISTPKHLTECMSLADGVNLQDVEELVKLCLHDPKINIGGIPDWIECQIYRATILFTLNGVYQALHDLEGKEFLGHQLIVTRVPRRQSRLQQEIWNIGQSTVDQEDVLEQVADRLLLNKDINQPLIPDALERRLYASCLKIVFRLLDLVAASFRLKVCGHEIQVHLQPSTDLNLPQYALQRAKQPNHLASNANAKRRNKTTSVNMQHMMQVAREMGQQADQRRSFWQRWASPANNEFVAQLHATVYCLVLGIVDDLLEHTEIQLLSDRLRLNLVPSLQSSSTVDNTTTQNTVTSKQPTKNQLLYARSIALPRLPVSQFTIHKRLVAGIGDSIEKSLPWTWY
jgi:hypothetical protein